jgi:hypothetical protein
MYLNNYVTKQNRFRFNEYASGIKEELLNQAISTQSSSRKFYETKYNELLCKYLDMINIFNYNVVCVQFIHDIYELMPVYDTV